MRSHVTECGSQSHEQISSHSPAIPQPPPQKEELSRTGTEDDSKFEEEEYNSEGGKERAYLQKKTKLLKNRMMIYTDGGSKSISMNAKVKAVQTNSLTQSLTIADIFCDKFLLAYIFSFSPNVDTNDDNDDNQPRTLEDRLLGYLTSPAFSKVNGISLRF